MKDTSEQILDKWHTAFDALSPEARVRMACSMFDFARELITASIRNEAPDISEPELLRRILYRTYGDDFKPETLDKIFQSISEKSAHPPGERVPTV